MGISVVINALVSRHLLKVARETDSIALEADGQQHATDVWTSLGVFAGMVLIQITSKLGFSSGKWIDPAVALVVAGMIIRVSLGLTHKAAAPLLDTRLPDTEQQELIDIVMRPQRSWAITSCARASRARTGRSTIT